MVAGQGLIDLVGAVDLVVEGGVPGAFVECGTWRGGASFLMARRALRRGERRIVWMFDSFEGLPAPKEIDGPAAASWATDTSSPNYLDNCRADIEDVQRSIDRLGLEGVCLPVKGWFNDTLITHKHQIQRIALLRIDGDWYESVKVCLAELVPLVSPGGIVILDDYWTWDGCAQAVHEYLAVNQLPYRISELGGAAFRIAASNGFPGIRSSVHLYQ
jgi:O-methyltransferase